MANPSFISSSLALLRGGGGCSVDLSGSSCWSFYFVSFLMCRSSGHALLCFVTTKEQPKKVDADEMLTIFVAIDILIPSEVPSNIGWYYSRFKICIVFSIFLTTTKTTDSHFKPNCKFCSNIWNSSGINQRIHQWMRM